MLQVMHLAPISLLSDIGSFSPVVSGEGFEMNLSADGIVPGTTVRKLSKHESLCVGVDPEGVSVLPRAVAALHVLKVAW